MHDAHATKRMAKATFEAWAQTYDRSLLNRFLFRPSYEMLIEEIARRQHTDRPAGGGLDILDVGCGTGTLLSMIARSSLEVNRAVGLDYAMEMCQQARRKSAALNLPRPIQFLHADSEHLPFADACFDVITCANSFHHYPHQQAVVSEMHRILRPQGRLMIVDGFRDNVIGWVVFDVIITTLEKSVFHAPWTTMRRYFQNAGFRDVHHRKFNFLLPAFMTVGAV